MKIIVWNSREKQVADYHALMKGCDILCLLECRQWEVPERARQIQGNLFCWKEEDGNQLYDVIYCMEGVAFICRKGIYTGEAVIYKVHSSIGALAGICLKNNFWLFANHEMNVANSYHISEFYLREISDRFKKAAFIADFKERSYSWTQETVGKLYYVDVPESDHSRSVNHLFAIHVVCKDQYLIKGYEGSSNQPTFFELEI